MKLNKHKILMGLASVSLAIAPCRSHAAAKKPTPPATAAVISSAEVAFKAGQFDRASELYEQAWKSNPTDTTLLYNAARCAQLAAKLERAEALYADYLGLNDHEQKYLDKAKAYRADVRSALAAAKAERATAIANQAAQLQRERRFSEAATQYFEAYRHDESQLVRLLLAAEAAALACEVDLAKQHLRLLRSKAVPGSLEADQATARLDTVERACEPSPGPTPIAPPGVEPPPPAEMAAPAARHGPWILGGTGLALLVGGGVLAGLGASRWSQLQADSAAQKYANDEAGLAVERAAIQDSYYTPGNIAMGLGGAAVLGAAVWFFVGREAAPAAVAVGSGSVSVAVRF